MLMFTEGKNIYGSDVNNIDKGFAIVSLFLSKGSNFFPSKSLKVMKYSSYGVSYIYSLLKDYEILPQEDPYGNID